MPSELSQSNSQEFIMVDLTPDEEHLLQLLEDIKQDTIWVNRTQKGIVPGTFDTIKMYYTDLEAVHILESLVRKEMLKRIDNGILLLCPSCGNHKTSVVKSCPSCGSNKLRQRNKIVHTPCEHWGTFDEFNGGNTITCPVCNESIETNNILDNKSGFNYSDPYYECQECGFSSNKVPSMYLCTKCKTKFNSNNAVLLEQSGFHILVDPVSEADHSRPPLKQPPKKLSTSVMIEQLQRMAQMHHTKEDTFEELSPTEAENIDLNSKIAEKPDQFEPEPPVKPKLVQDNPKETLENIKTKKRIREKTEKRKKEVETPAVDPATKIVNQVLLVVEEQITYNLILESLEKSGETMEVTLVEDGARVLKTLREPFDLLIFDSELSTIDPSLVLDEITKWKIKTPIILLDNGYLKGIPFGLNMVATLKRKQRDIEKIKGLVSEIF